MLNTAARFAGNKFIYAALVLSAMGFHANVSLAQTKPSQPEADEVEVAPSQAAAKSVIPTSVVEVNALGQKLFESAKAQDWTKCAANLTALQDAMKRMKTEIPKPSSTVKRHQTQLGAHLTAVEKAIAGKQRPTAMLEANRIIRVSGLTMETYSSAVPASIMQLQYLSRELEVGAASSDLKMLKTLPARMDTEWKKIGTKMPSAAASDAKDFADRLANLKTVATADDYDKSSAPLLASLDKIARTYSAK